LRKLFPGSPADLELSDVAFPLKSASYCSAVHSNPTGCRSKGNFSAALLSGGRSVRMGRDKAHIAVTWKGEAVPLRVRQLRLLQSLEPEELFCSGPPPADDQCEAKIVTDEWPDAGPLSGIASCLKLTTTGRLLCLAVDVARMDASILLKLLEKCSTDRGIVPRIGERYEPLVAVYPKASLPFAVDQMKRRNLRLQDFVRRLRSEHLIGEYLVSDEETALFANWNTPEDVR
jgi:molybdopterin-guanine dinucleotide biosynthesis protein A